MSSFIAMHWMSSDTEGGLVSGMNIFIWYRTYWVSGITSHPTRLFLYNTLTSNKALFVQHPHFQQSYFCTTPSLPTWLFLYKKPHFQQSPFCTTPSLPTTPDLYNTFTSHITMFVKHPFVQLPSLQQPYSYNAKAYIAKVSEPIIGIFWGRGANK